MPYGLPGDRLRVDVLGKKQGALRGKIEEVITPSELRQPTECNVFGKCGGCSWLHFSYPAQAEWKRKVVASTLKRIGKIDMEVGWLDDPELRFGYRTRATVRGADGSAGFFESGSHAIVDIEGCPLCHDKLNVAIRTIREQKLEGQFDITVNPEGDEVLIWTDKPSPELKSLFPLANSPEDAGKRSSFDFDGIPILNGAFSQSSLLLNRMLVSHVCDLLGGTQSLLDLYCGAGNFSLRLAEKARVVGIDHSGPAIMAAGRIGKGEYRIGDERVFAEMIGTNEWDAILLDPPRAGARKVVKALAGSTARCIVYVSCDPATFARDAQALLKAGWKIDQTTAVDMFPHTAHIETVCRFTRS